MVKSSHFNKCKKGDGVFQGNVIKTMTSPRRLRCFESCTADDTCKSLNVCPSGQRAGHSDCQLMDDRMSKFCYGLSPDPEQDCFHAEKHIQCRNGATVRADGSCRCALCYKGETCQENARDCKEAREVLSPDSGYSLSSGHDCTVRPTTATHPFTVRCPFGSSNETSVFMRVQADNGWSGIEWKSQKWNAYKTGMGTHGSLNFFIGLENLHYFLSQAQFRLNLFTSYYPLAGELAPPPTVNSYKNFSIANETSRYALSYVLYTNTQQESTPETEGFKAANVSHPFCTEDNDCGTCAKDKGPGWYYVFANGSCVGNNPFGKPGQWPYEGKGLLTFNNYEFFIERIGDFF
ncbi:hypothetical protein V1264_006293 [Littorina saxatilis]|uniref:Fibrinogen C-terminal domain-containing protein n=1 Tax=Littorina saxatilis TaxID=31220 RepID=A0AAN9G5L5_9CAEN